jgi:hypothetical protein
LKNAERNRTMRRKRSKTLFCRRFIQDSGCTPVPQSVKSVKINAERVHFQKRSTQDSKIVYSGAWHSRNIC